jgi:hypothetical protein
MSDAQAIRRIHRLTALVLLAAVLFYGFFQVNKRGPLGAISPFAVDPYDAVGSFAFQVALLAVLLTYARALRLRDDPTLAPRSRFILRGNLLALFAILATLLADAWAVFQTLRAGDPLIAEALRVSFWGRVLLGELAGMFLVALACGVALLLVFAPLTLDEPPRDLTPADAIDDLWALARLAALRAPRWLPGPLLEWVTGFSSDRLFARLGWLDPRRHPWRFAATLGLLAGLALFAAQLQEGLPPNLGIGLLAAAIFIGGEWLATLIGFALLGGFLGLRPSR